eukprot:c28898_g1_i1 orf=877-3093(-)
MKSVELLSSDADQSFLESASVGSSPRSSTGATGKGCGGVEETGRVKLMCSFGGKIVPRPHDNQLRYVGGETRIVVVSRNVVFAEFVEKLSRLFGSSLVVKYQLPSEDLDALISVTCDEDLENMMEECDRFQAWNRSAKLRLFLFPNEFGSQNSLSDLLENGKNREHWFVEALNGLPFMLLRGRSETSSVVSEIPDYLFGLDGMDEATLSSQARASSFDHLGSAKSQQSGRKSGEIFSNPGSPMSWHLPPTIQFTSSAPPSMNSVASTIIDTGLASNPTKLTAPMQMDDSFSDVTIQQQKGTSERQELDESTGGYIANGLKRQPGSETFESRDQSFLHDEASVISPQACKPYTLSNDLQQMEGPQNKFHSGEALQQPNTTTMNPIYRPVDNLQSSEQKQSNDQDLLPCGGQVEFAETFYRKSPPENEKQADGIDSSDGRLRFQTEEVPLPRVPTTVSDTLLVQLDGFDVQPEGKMESSSSAQELKSMQENERYYAQIMDLQLETEEAMYATQPRAVQKQIGLPTGPSPAVNGTSHMTHQSPLVQPHGATAPPAIPSVLSPMYSEGLPLRAGTGKFSPSSHVAQFSRQVSDTGHHLPRARSPYRDLPSGHALHSRFRAPPGHLYPAVDIKREGVIGPSPALRQQSRVPQHNDQINCPQLPQVVYVDPNVMYANYGMQGPTQVSAQRADKNTFTDDILRASPDQPVSAIRYQEVLYDQSSQDHHIMMDVQHLQGRHYVMRN